MKDRDGAAHRKGAVDLVQHSIQRLKDEGGEVLYGGERLTVPGGCYMKPCLAMAKPDFEIVKHGASGPLLYLMTYSDSDEAITIQNGVPQGLTSSIFRRRARSREIRERGRKRLRHREREYRHQRRGNRRRVWW